MVHEPLLDVVIYVLVELDGRRASFNPSHSYSHFIPNSSLLPAVLRNNNAFSDSNAIQTFFAFSISLLLAAKLITIPKPFWIFLKLSVNNETYFSVMILRFMPVPFFCCRGGHGSRWIIFCLRCTSAKKHDDDWKLLGRIR